MHTTNIDMWTSEVGTKGVDLVFSKFKASSGTAGPTASSTRILQPRILRSLDFPGRKSRQETVAAAQFQWVFNTGTDNHNNTKGADGSGRSSKSGISQWLNEGNGYYWLSGKAGCGKSTLMNFLISSPETKTALSRWARTSGGSGASKAVIISYFFWASGKPLQKDIRGLLRAFICQILENDPSMANIVVDSLRLLTAGQPHYQAAMTLEHRILDMISSEAELTRVLFALLDYGRTKKLTRYCFFIDALGECKGDVFGFLDKLVSRAPHVKVCASSCPWPSFEHHFRNSARLTFGQGHTSQGISRHFREQLNRQMAQASKDDTAHTNLVMEEIASKIISRSGGVFLWAVLVTREVCDGLAKGDSLDDSLKTVEAAPSGVRDLITVILNRRRADGGERESATECLTLRSASKQPMDLLTFSVASLEEVRTANHRDDLRSILVSDAQPRVKEITETFSDRTAGLLEVSYNANDEVKKHELPDHPLFSLMGHDVGFVHDSVTTVLEDSSSKTVASLIHLLKASVLISTWLNDDAEQAWTQALSARASKQAFEFAKSISEYDPNEHGHEEFLQLLSETQ